MKTPYKYLLDTNILSDLIRNPNGRAAQQLKKYGEHTVATSLIISAEIRFGMKKSGNRTVVKRVGQLLEHIPILPLEKSVDEHYSAIRHHLEKRGTPIGPNDLIIAAHARALGLIMVTDNEREFKRVPNLQVENWLT